MISCEKDGPYIGFSHCPVCSAKYATEMGKTIRALETALAAMTAERDALRESNIRNHRGAVVIVELTKRLTSGNAVHHARNIGTIAGAIADRSARAAVEGESK